MPKGVKQDHLPEFEPRVVGQYTAGNGQTYQIKLCHFDYCEGKHYSRGLCKPHYARLDQGYALGPIIRPWLIEPGECEFDGCTNRSRTRVARINYCTTHINMRYRYEGLRPIEFYINEGYSEDRDRRVCKDCGQEKPIEQFYKLAKRPGVAVQGRRTNCKDCYKWDITYYQGRAWTKADGSDPLGWQDNPEAKLEKAEETYARQRVTSRAWMEQKKAEKNA